MNHRVFLASILLLCPAISHASVTASISARDDNALNLQADWDTDGALINYRDCVDDIHFTITINVSEEDTDGRELYIFAGSNCDDSEDTTDCDEDIIEIDADKTTVDLPVSFIINADDCSDEDSSSVWVGLLESSDEKDDNATWASPIDFDFNGKAPSPPENISVSPGENNLYVTWDNDEDNDDVAGFIIVYARADETADEIADAGVDGGVDDTCTGPLSKGSSVTTDMSWEGISSGSATGGRVENLVNGTPYQTAVATVDEYGNPSSLSQVVCESPGETLDFLELYCAAGGCAAAGHYCFVATAAFGGYDHPVVRVLRRFRDEIILQLPLGKQFVALYYRIGPTLVQNIHSEHTYQLLRAGLLVLSGAALAAMDFRSTFLFPLIAFLLFPLLMTALAFRLFKPKTARSSCTGVKSLFLGL